MFGFITSHAQFKKYAFFEHYTQASCGPCASQNPRFEAVRNVLKYDIHHIAYHTSFPGSDPMYSFNTSQIKDRTSYHGVNAVPTMIMNGDVFRGGPANVSTDLIGSNTPNVNVRLKVTMEKVEDGFQAKVQILRNEDFDNENLYLHAAVVESLITYTSAPGSNGEKEFPNVFRKMLTDPKVGMEYTPSADASVIDEVDFTFANNTAYNEDELYVLAWLEEKPSKHIINSGSSKDLDWQYISLENNNIKESNSHVFKGRFTRFEEETPITIRLNTDAPDEWFNLYVDGYKVETGQTSYTVQNPGESVDIDLRVQTNGASGVYKHKISVSPPNDLFTNQSQTFITVSNVTDLIVNHGTNSLRWDDEISAGLDAAGKSSYGKINVNNFVNAYESGLLRGVENIYDNVGWTFPGFVNGETDALKNFLDEGGNLFISGQDLGWDTWANDNNVNNANRAFYRDYLKTKYLDDGDSANSELTPVDEGSFSELVTSRIINVNGGSNFYPDELEPIGDQAKVIYTYGANGPAGAIRTDNGTNKTVYLGIDLGMIQEESVRQQIVKITSDYFAGLFSSTEYDRLIKLALGQNYPNPAIDFTTIEYDKLSQNAVLKISDMMGNVLLSQNIKAGTTSSRVDVRLLPSGQYTYHLLTTEGATKASMLQVIK